MYTEATYIIYMHAECIFMLVQSNLVAKAMAGVIT